MSLPKCPNGIFSTKKKKKPKCQCILERGAITTKIINFLIKEKQIRS